MRNLVIGMVAGIVLAGCGTTPEMLRGKWSDGSGVELSFGKRKYDYCFSDGDGYETSTSGRCKFVAPDSLVLFVEYPDAYTAESKNGYYKILKLSDDSLALLQCPSLVVLDGDTLNTGYGETIIDEYVRQGVEP